MKLLKKNRREQGALELNTVEAEAVVENGLVRDLVIQRQNMARCLIEEFMVAANGTMVNYLGDAGIPMIQRVVRIPKNWEGIVMVAAMYHENLPAKPDAKALAKFLIRQKAADPERFPDLSLTVIKLLGPWRIYDAGTWQRAVQATSVSLSPITPMQLHPTDAMWTSSIKDC